MHCHRNPDEYGIPASTNMGRFQYTGQAWLPAIGMYYYKARIYSPTLGRFLQTDPIGYAEGINWYNYVGSDPVNGVDPSGLDCVGFGCGSNEVVTTPFRLPTTSGSGATTTGVFGYGVPYKGAYLNLGRPAKPLRPIQIKPQKNCPAPPTPGPRKAELDRNIRNARNDRPGSRAGPQNGGLSYAWRLKRDVTGSQNYKANPLYGNPGARFGNFNYGATAAARGFSLDTILRASDAFDRWENLWEEGDPFSGDDAQDIQDVTDGYNYAKRGC